MGGGEFMKAAAKIAGIGAVNGGLRGASTVPQFQQLLRGISKPASVVVPSFSSSRHVQATVGAELEVIQKPASEVNGWEFATFEYEADGLEPRIVFGPVPSFEEAKEATAELKEALDKVYLSSPESYGSNLTASANCELETKSCLIIESSPHASVPKHAIQAFQLLNESSEAQTVVASIASDPNVWNAMLSNQVLKSFLQSCQTNEGLQPQKLSEEPEDVPDASNAKESGNSFSNMLEHIKISIADMVANASSFLQKKFGFPAAEVSDDDKATSGFTSVEKTMGASIMGLVILVITVLVTKRN